MVIAEQSLEQWVDRATALAPLLERYRQEGEGQRHLPHELFVALRRR